MLRKRRARGAVFGIGREFFPGQTFPEKSRNGRRATDRVLIEIEPQFAFAPAGWRMIGSHLLNSRAWLRSRCHCSLASTERACASSPSNRARRLMVGDSLRSASLESSWTEIVLTKSAA